MMMLELCSWELGGISGSLVSDVRSLVLRERKISEALVSGVRCLVLDSVKNLSRVWS